MIKICDAIMGTGKSSAAITYMNEHPDGKYIYITPYLNEANRIKKGCPKLEFVEPSDKIPKYRYKKSLHTAALIKSGANITTTHQSFKRYSEDTIEDIRNHEYTLIIDESVDVLETFEFSEDDLQLMVDAGYVKTENGIYTLIKDNYGSGALSDIFGLLRSRDLIRIDSEDESSAFYWTIPPELFLAFKDVIVLTYLFKGQSLCYFMNIFDLPYSYIGIEKSGRGKYRFCEGPGYIPPYVEEIKNKIDIIDSGKINDIGSEPFSLSLSWYRRNEKGPEQVRKNLYNYFNNICRGIPPDKKLWGAFNDAKLKIQGKGYCNSFLNFNARATNAYRDRNCLAYPVNLFMNVNEKIFYKKNNIVVDEDTYALSIMIQWIWRSQIREGDRIKLYIPSKRMRNILKDWMSGLKKEL